MLQSLPNSVLQMSVIFLSIVIEALPFVLLGCLISGALQVFLTPERVTKILPKNKLASIAMGCGLGVFFPSCECGIVPIVNQFVKKDVPVYTAFAFMLTAPIVNPIVIFSTFIAFGNSAKFAFLRVLGSLLVAMVVGVWLAYFSKQEILKTQLITASEDTHQGHHHGHAHDTGSEKRKWFHQIRHLLQHSIDEFFDTGRYLIIGGLIAAAMQTYLPTGMMLTLGSTKFLAVLVMLVLALTMSLCSEADAFIGSSLLSLFGAGPVVGFLVFGPMVDIKNLLMMKRYFTGRFIATMVGLIAVVVSIYAWVV
ncbi:permease [Enterococcus gallinarum]|uniref:Permease n=1 Tax=Enterococcus gallinarum TaxID=1353 RepID=A0ABD4ZTE0_ENTGA|nr:permease [Enterococcus gallinarum]MBF0822763.1 permease [Enterococcus faecalis]MBF0727707.1 permease [Enterococcus gallinarum]MBF0797191.1 permease [Enterococcus gallinarum]MBX8977072.1 permease [Enterococcus gallinarum]MCR1928002.1 permease [Enterococcus gallinarum]